MNKDDIAYAAGLFDAEGSVSINERQRKHNPYPHPCYQLQVNLTSVYWPVLNWFKNNFGGCISRDKRKKKPCFQWGTRSNIAADFLQEIILDLRIKRLQVELALEFQEKQGKNKGYYQVTTELSQYRRQLKNQIETLNYNSPFRKFSDENRIAYIAGLLDGDGFIFISACKPHGFSPVHYLRIGVSICNQSIIIWLRSNLGGLAQIEKKHSGWGDKPRSQWTIGRNRAENILKQILPYLRIKKPQAELALQFQKKKKRHNQTRRLTTEKLRQREQFRICMKVLNRLV